MDIGVFNIYSNLDPDLDDSANGRSELAGCL